MGRLSPSSDRLVGVACLSQATSRLSRRSLVYLLDHRLAGIRRVGRQARWPRRPASKSFNFSTHSNERSGIVVSIGTPASELVPAALLNKKGSPRLGEARQSLFRQIVNGR